MKTMLFNPYTGMPRHPDDIKSDPQGLLIVEPGSPLLERIAELEQQLEQARQQMGRQKDEWLAWEAKRKALESAAVELEAVRKDAERWQKVSNMFAWSKSSASAAVLEGLGIFDADPCSPLSEAIDKINNSKGA